MTRGIYWVVLLALCGPVGAATNLWDGDTSGDWGTAANWAGDTPFADGDDVEFYALPGTNLTTTLGANRIINMLLFNSNATNSVSISGNTLTLLGGISRDPASV